MFTTDFTVDSFILDALNRGGKMTRREIAIYVAAVKWNQFPKIPRDLNYFGDRISPRLTVLVQRGEILRIKKGVYEIL